MFRFITHESINNTQTNKRYQCMAGRTAEMHAQELVQKNLALTLIESARPKQKPNAQPCIHKNKTVSRSNDPTNTHISKSEASAGSSYRVQ